MPLAPHPVIRPLQSSPPGTARSSCRSSSGSSVRARCAAALLGLRPVAALLASPLSIQCQHTHKSMHPCACVVAHSRPDGLPSCAWQGMSHDEAAGPLAAAPSVCPCGVPPPSMLCTAPRLQDLSIWQPMPCAEVPDTFRPHTFRLKDLMVRAGRCRPRCQSSALPVHSLRRCSPMAQAAICLHCPEPAEPISPRGEHMPGYSAVTATPNGRPPT